MNLSRSSQYAIRALAYLAEREPGQLSPVRQVAARVGIPLPFLNKIISRLSQQGMITTRRGPNGGAMLACPPDRLTIGDVVTALDGPLCTDQCYLGLHECSEAHPCPVHESWLAVRLELERSLHMKTFGDLSRAGRKRLRSKQQGATRRRGA